METGSLMTGRVSDLTGGRLIGNIVAIVRPMQIRHRSFMTPDRSTLRTDETHANRVCLSAPFTSFGKETPRHDCHHIAGLMT